MIFAPYDIQKCRKEHAPNDVQNAHILPSCLLNSIQKLTPLGKVLVSHINYVLVDSCNLFRLSLEIDLCRNGNISRVMTNLDSLTEGIILHQKFALLPIHLLPLIILLQIIALVDTVHL